MVFGIIVLIVVVIVILVAFVSHFDPSNPNSSVNSNNTSTMSGTWQSDQETPVTVDNSGSEVEQQKMTEKMDLDLNLLQNRIKKLEVDKINLIAHIKEQNKYLTKAEQLSIDYILKENKIRVKIADLNQKIREKQNLLRNLKNQIVELNDEILLQEFGLYRPTYSFATSGQYKEKLMEIREQQKEMIRNKVAATCSVLWAVNESRFLGERMVNNQIKEILLTFNTECEYVISKVKFNNYDSMRKRIEIIFNKLNRLNKVNQISISDRFYELKLEELALAYEYEEKKQQEKEYMREQREIARENAKVQRELEEERTRLEKEQIHYKNQLQKLNEQLETETNNAKKEIIQEKISAVNNELDDIQKALADVDFRQANERVGYVYVISNIGSFGEDIYKIGMTRRSNPQDRIDELSGASVPFRFDFHAKIFSYDAPKLETLLHNRLAPYRVNMVNNRKEFYHVDLKEIKKLVDELKNEYEYAEFTEEAEAQQFRESVKMRHSEKQVS